MVFTKPSLTQPAAAEGTIRGCQGFRSLLPAYRAGTLPEARALLVEDHLRHCVACRNSDRVEAAAGPAARRGEWRLAPRLAIAAALLATAGLAALTVVWLAPARGARAVVQSVAGNGLYLMSDTGVLPLAAGQPVDEGQEIRSAKGSGGMLRLTDGSLVEVSERADLSISRDWGGTTINLQRGNIIVQAAPQRHGRLYVAAGDSLVSVKGTIFAVSRGTKGSRVSVLQGEVKVEQNRAVQLLHPGDQSTSSAALAKFPLAQQVAWSRDSARYLALVSELSALGKQIEAVPGQGLRYSSKLAAYVPADAIVYAAIPNLSNTLAEASRLFDERAQKSEVLREWWTQERGAELRQVLDKVRGVSEYLGDEIVIAVSPDAGGKLRRPPVVLAEVTRPGLADYVARKMPGGPNLTVRDNLAIFSPGNAATAVPATAGGFLRTPFYQNIAPAYQQGAGWLFSADMEQILRRSVGPERMKALLETGLGDVRYLTVERKESDGQIQNHATLSFSNNRRGIVAWLAAPAPMGSLDFVSPSATVAASFVVQNPAAALQELIATIEAKDPAFAQRLAAFQTQTGVDVVNDIAGSLGGDFTFAVDGPLVPTPSWKLSVEVLNPGRLESSIEALINGFNRLAPADAGKLTLSKDTSGGSTFYTITGDKLPGEIDYTFVDGYLVAGSSRALVQSAISNRAAGITLARSQTFRSLLPIDGYANFSALVYQNLASSVGALASQLKAAGTLAQNSEPSLIYAYGEPDKIVVASKGSFFGLTLDSLLMGRNPLGLALGRGRRAAPSGGQTGSTTQ